MEEIYIVWSIVGVCLTLALFLAFRRKYREDKQKLQQNNNYEKLKEKRAEEVLLAEEEDERLDPAIQLSRLGVSLFVLAMVWCAVMIGITTLIDTEDDTNLSSNVTEFLSSVALFADYGELFVIVGIVAVLMLLVSSFLGTAHEYIEDKQKLQQNNNYEKLKEKRAEKVLLDEEGDELL